MLPAGTSSASVRPPPIGNGACRAPGEPTMDRREFLKHSTVLGAGVATLGSGALAGRAVAAGEKVIVGVMGVNGRGKDLCNVLAANPNAEIAYICDVDERALAKA